MILKFSYVDMGVHEIFGQSYGVGISIIQSENQAREERFENYIVMAAECLCSTPSSCDALIDLITAISNGEKESGEWLGRCDTGLVINNQGVQVNVYCFDERIDQPEGLFTFDEVIKVMACLRQLLLMPKSIDSFVEIEI